MGNEQQNEGMLDQVEGNIKEGVGKITGNEKMEYEGKAQQGEGKVREGVGNCRRTSRSATRRTAGFQASVQEAGPRARRPASFLMFRTLSRQRREPLTSAR